MYFPEIGQKIRGLRVDKYGEGHGAQKKFAEFLEINYVTYRGYEKGNVTLEALNLISKKTGATFTVGAREVLRVAEETAPYEPFPMFTDEEKEYMEKLVEVLRNPRTEKAIKENLNTFLEVPKPSPGPELKKKEG